jgi:uncharacterized membrane protein
MKPSELKKVSEELRRLRKPILNPNVRHKENFSLLEKIAVKLTEYVGSIGFFFIIFGWTVLWLGWNTIAPKALRFDPFPAFVLWLFVSNVIQICLMPLIMIGQTLQGRHAEMRAEADFSVNVRAEKENEVILLHLEQQSELIMEILKKLENSKKD